MATATMVLSAICDVVPDNWRECCLLENADPSRARV